LNIITSSFRPYQEIILFTLANVFLGLITKILKKAKFSNVWVNDFQVGGQGLKAEDFICVCVGGHSGRNETFLCIFEKNIF
jgi:hypothetical protein